MDETARQELLTKTKEALDADDWDAVESIWHPWIEQGEAEAEFQLAYHYLCCTSCDDDALSTRMEALMKNASAKDHPDALWYVATHVMRSQQTSEEFQQQLLRAGQLGSSNAKRSLGVMYATGDWSGPQDLVEAARWYRLAAKGAIWRNRLDEYERVYWLTNRRYTLNGIVDAGVWRAKPQN
ncbi:MAG TPA: hypothetical protein VE621_23795 [Bryobacteraceae bacterium]|nr:hypothetical protein [Bryobacteraceae bacterium]